MTGLRWLLRFQDARHRDLGVGWLLKPRTGPWRARVWERERRVGGVVVIGRLGIFWVGP